MYKIFKALEISDNKDFLEYMKKKYNAQIDDELRNNIKTIIKMIIIKYNNIVDKAKTSKIKNSKKGLSRD